MVWTEGKLFLLCSGSSASSIELHPHLDKTSALLSPNATYIGHPFKGADMQAMTKRQHQQQQKKKSIKCISAEKELLSNTRCNPVNFDCNDGSEGFKNASKAQKKTEERNLP